MTPLTAESSHFVPGDSPHEGSAASDSGFGPLRELQQRLLRAVTEEASKEAAIVGIAHAVEEVTKPVCMLYLERDEERRWNMRHLLHRRQDNMSAERKEQLLTWCDDACRHGSVQINSAAPPQDEIVVTSPIVLPGRPPDAVAAVYRPPTEPVDRLLVVHQLIATHVAMWQVLHEAQQAEFEAQMAASLMELLAGLESAGDLREACCKLVNEIQAHLGCQRVALGLCARRSDHCHLYALSGMAQFDKRSELVRLFDAALNEAVVRDSVTAWPVADSSGRQGGLALEKLRTLTGAGCVVSCPLRDDEDNLVGSWLFLQQEASHERAATLRFVEASTAPVGSRIRLLQRAERSRITRLVQAVTGPGRTTRRKVLVAAVCLLAAGLCAPLRYRVSCECTVQPIVRRVVAAPYDGILEKSYVEPGDLVAAGQLLARMDEREVKWEMSSVGAEFDKASKERDTAMALRDVAAAQRAKLEMRRLELKKTLLQYRADNLEIRSPVAGIVIRGDLEKVEGAPLAVGKSLFEVAPLAKVLVELAIPDCEVRQVRTGAAATIRLEAYPWRKWQGHINKISPQSEICEHDNVFVAEVGLANSDLRLRPGMKGRARIDGPRRPLAWILFHKPCESVMLWLGW